MGPAGVIETLAPLAALAVLIAAPAAVAAIHRRRTKTLDRPDLAPGLATVTRRAGLRDLEIRVAPCPAGARRRPPAGRLVGGVLGRPAAILSEELLDGPPERAELVLAHEAAHLRLGHPRWLLILAAGCILAVHPLAAAVPGDAFPWDGLPVILAGLAVSWRIASRWILRRFEEEADAGAAGHQVRGASLRMAIGGFFLLAAALYALSMVRALG